MSVTLESENTAILSADFTVLKRCATIIIVSSDLRFSNDCCIKCSETESNDDEYSSKSSIFGFERSALIIVVECYL